MALETGAAELEALQAAAEQAAATDDGRDKSDAKKVRASIAVAEGQVRGPVAQVEHTGIAWRAMPNCPEFAATR